MCSYCGCDAITVVGRFMAEHVELTNVTGLMRRAAEAGDEEGVRRHGAAVARLLHPHTHAEEAGLFTVMREQAEFTDHVDTLCAEHTSLDGLLAAVVGGELHRAREFDDALRAHMDKEDNGLFPAAAVSLDGTDWERVDATTPPAEDLATGNRSAASPLP